MSVLPDPDYAIIASANKVTFASQVKRIDGAMPRLHRWAKGTTLSPMLQDAFAGATEQVTITKFNNTEILSFRNSRIIIADLASRIPDPQIIFLTLDKRFTASTDNSSIATQK
jgi:hypothetical protein